MSSPELTAAEVGTDPGLEDLVNRYGAHAELFVQAVDDLISDDLSAYRDYIRIRMTNLYSYKLRGESFSMPEESSLRALVRAVEGSTRGQIRSAQYLLHHA